MTMTDLDSDDLFEDLIDTEPPAESPTQPWRVGSDRDANRILRSIGVLRAERERIKADFTAEIRELQDRKTTKVGVLDRKLARREALLFDYRRQLEVENPDLPKTYTLARGAIARRKAAAGIKVTDTRAFILWAALNERLDLFRGDPVLTSMKKDLDLTGEKVVDPKTGEVVPGVEPTHPDDTYSVQLATHDESEF